MNKIIIPESIWIKAEKYLQSDRYGNFVFFFCGINECDNGVTFLVKDFVRIKDEGIELSKQYSVQIKLSEILKITNRAYSENFALVEAHNHPFSGNRVGFSFTDIDGFEEFVPYALDYLLKPYGATVWGKKGFEGKMWKRSDDEEKIHEIKIIGNNVKSIISSSESSGQGKNIEKRANRQVLALGEEGQCSIGKTRVAIVGLGGIGSHVAQQLAYLGVRDFILVDFDKIQVENLNRIIGATPDDLLNAKVDVSARLIRLIAGKKPVKVKPYRSNLRNAEVIESLKSVDVIFGCVDNDGARLILNELAQAYIIPYFDSAFGFHLENGHIVEAGGRLIVNLPDGPCLLCCKDIDIEEASYFLSDLQERKFREERGYISGAIIPSPSLVSLDGIIASIAVTEFTAFITGIRNVIQYSAYDFLHQRVSQRIVPKSSDCVHCIICGQGDKSGILRYALDSCDAEVKS